MSARPRCAHRSRYKLFKTLAAPCANGNRGNAQQPAELFTVKMHTAALYYIRHVKTKHRGNIYFKKLKRQIQTSLKAGSVRNIDYNIRAADFARDKVAGKPFFFARGVKRICARQIKKAHRFFAGFKFAFFYLHRHPGKVCSFKARARKGVEKRRLAAVRVAGKRYFQLGLSHLPPALRNMPAAHSMPTA